MGETYTVTVDYFPPSIDIPGLDREPESLKTMIYTIVVSGDKKTITSLKIAESSGPLYENGEKN